MTEFEERADQLSIVDIESTLSDGKIFRDARRKLLSRGAKLLVGPRGTGKTHLMRYTYLQAMKDSAAPLPAYANFSRYLSLEPLLKKSPDALARFQSWVIARLILSAFDLIKDMSKAHPKTTSDIITEYQSEFNEASINQFVALLERGSASDEYDSLSRLMTVKAVLDIFTILAKKYRRSRIILLLDDAALSLTNEYLIAFFEIYRLLKTEFISPKASVYPGSTQYGPTFHTSHEAEEVELWLSVEDPEYISIMGDIGSRRLHSAVTSISEDTLNHFKYVAFGSPRAYLRMIRDFSENPSGSAQSRANRVTEKHVELLWLEYDSLAIKLRQFASVIRIGHDFLESAVLQIIGGQNPSGSDRTIVLGLQQDVDRTPLVDRMLRFLIEVGLLYPLNSPVSHGKNRRYDRYIVHLAFLHSGGAFRQGRGSSPRDLPAYMQRPASKHPVRAKLSSLLTESQRVHLVLDLPPCQRCGAVRINESQRFCHTCGEQLVVASLFDQCMKLPLSNVPGISTALISRLSNETKIRTVGDIYSSQSPGADLQKASYIGPKRADGIIGAVSLVVEEWLS
ncbi:hypothetical protein XCY_000076 [Xanthomonas arboricola pv. juglandis]|uniref:hypothetical protein n=1 Tax=Xanthomonas arboricola TaxID=56448 RepID=UPI001AF84063|nr:hypothetical protein [Xanthomonas arboricola]CAG2082213.1 hypothetical protein XCY_000076 [Xanthomonas arboricola pv. juglandis]